MHKEGNTPLPSLSFFVYQFINTVDDVERITSYDFFPALPDSIEDGVEAYADIKEW